MSRPLRLEFPDALYHVTSRGDRREDIYHNDDDRQTWLNAQAMAERQTTAVALIQSLGGGWQAGK